MFILAIVCGICGILGGIIGIAKGHIIYVLALFLGIIGLVVTFATDIGIITYISGPISLVGSLAVSNTETTHSYTLSETAIENYGGKRKCEFCNEETIHNFITPHGSKVRVCEEHHEYMWNKFNK